MASRRTPSAPPSRPLELTVSREELKQKLQNRIDKGNELRNRRVDTAEGYEGLKKDYYKWDSFNAELLKQTFTTDEMEQEYSAWVGVLVVSRGSSLAQEITETYKDIEKKIHRLDSIGERLELIPLARGIATAEKTSEKSLINNNRVFVVHGHDESSKTNLEIFLRENGLEPIVLHRQADQGLTLIEKFEKHSDVGYAFILLTPDEIAYVASEDKKPDGQRAKESRARPNVIFEFGYFVGRLTRSRVCCLYKGDVSLPSDVSGVVYKKFDKSVEEVGYSIIKDLKAAGYKLS